VPYWTPWQPLAWLTGKSARYGMIEECICVFCLAVLYLSYLPSEQSSFLTPSLPPHLLIYSFTPSTVVLRLLTFIPNCSLPYSLTLHSSYLFTHFHSSFLLSAPLSSSPLLSSPLLTTLTSLHLSPLLSSPLLSPLLFPPLFFPPLVLHSISLQHEESSAAAMFCAPCIGMGWCQSQE
jgi:hypothetical protein